jgi:hypothetical protein
MSKLLTIPALILIAIGFMAGPASAQKKANESLGCQEWNNGKLASHCEIREQSLPASGEVIKVDGRQNGGVSIKGWERNEILVRARIHSAAPTQAEAEALGKQVLIETAGANIFASGPEIRRDLFWSVSYEVFVPTRSNLSLKTHNGGISIADVTGQLEFRAVNGGVNLRNVGGTVEGGTTNGGLAVHLTGLRWDGEKMDINTTNGGIMISVPENYSAYLETGTVNGTLNIDFPVTVQGKITKQLAVNLGSGGSTIRAMTTNGGVKITRDEMKLL